MTLIGTFRSLFGSQYFWFTAMILPVGGAAGYWLRTREENVRQAEAAALQLTEEEERMISEQLKKQREDRRKHLEMEKERVQMQIRQLESKMREERMKGEDQ